MKRLTTILLLLAGACGDSSADTETSTGEATSSTTLAAEPCTPGESIACACTDGGEGAQVCAEDGLSFGECVCEPGGSTGGETDSGSSESGEVESETGTTTEDPSGDSETSDSSPTSDACDGVIDHSVTAIDDSALDGLVGVYRVEGALTIGEAPVIDDRLSCLQQVGVLTITGDHDLSPLSGLLSATSLFVTLSEPRALPDFTFLQITGAYRRLSLQNTDGGLFPKVSALEELHIVNPVACPTMDVDVELLTVTGNHSLGCLASAFVANLEVVDSSELPDALIGDSVSVKGIATTSLAGLNLAADLLPSEPGVAVSITGTDIETAEGLTSKTYGGRVEFIDNKSLSDISAIVGVEIFGDEIAVWVHGSPGVCQSHFEEVTGTLDTEGALVLEENQC